MFSMNNWNFKIAKFFFIKIDLALICNVLIGHVYSRAIAHVYFKRFVREITSVAFYKLTKSH